jgi:NADPH:quinone reductase-like Zn-dependent oxidoreductase
MESMKAIVYEKYGPPEVLHLADVEKPAPGRGQALIKVVATSLNFYDVRFMKADPFLVRIMGGGLFKPRNKILGEDIAGRVEAVGPGVSRFKAGDPVFGDLSNGGSGGLAEYVAANEAYLAPIPAGLGFEEAAALPMAAITALQGLRDAGRIEPGVKVLINGASGGVGTFAIQIAKILGANVAAVCSAGKMELARSLGADRVVDYAKEDFTKSEKRYDLILGANGFAPLSGYMRALNPGGIYVMTGGDTKQLMQSMLFGLFARSGKKAKTALAKPNISDLRYLAELVRTGKLKPVIDKRYPLSETAEAFRYLEQGHARGKVIIVM